jgi:putative heme-binding domain-containing protein
MPYASKLSGDSSVAVRREVAIALKNVPLPECRNTIIKLAKSYKGNDRWFLEALGYAMDGREDDIYPLLLQHLGNGDPEKWTTGFADLTWRLHPKGAVKSLQQRALSPRISESERKNAVVALAFIKDRKAFDAIRDLGLSSIKTVSDEADWWFNFRKTNDWFAFSEQLEDHHPSSHLKVDKNDKVMLSLQDQILGPAVSAEIKNKAAARMAKNARGGELLIALASEGKLSKNVRKVISQWIFANPDRAVRIQAGEFFERPGINKKFSITSITRLKPEAVKGKSIFSNSCAGCHKTGNAGGEVGPELTAIGKKYDRSGLLDAIINPSAGIVFGYEPWLLKTTGGKSLYGFVVADGETVVVKDMAGKQHAIQKDKIQSRKKMTGSLMPGPETLNLDEQKLADVTEYLLTLKPAN